MPIWTDYPTQTTPDDADTLLAHDVSETVVGNKMKRTTWANIKAAIKALTDTNYLGITATAADSHKADGAHASATPTASTIPIADAAGKLAVGWMPVILPNRNAIINGGFTINQRAYVSNAALAAGVYGHDRWKAGAGGGNYAFTQLSGPTTITIASGKTLIQVVENKNVYGGTYILSWTGTAQGRYAVNSATPAGAYAASPIIITGQTPGTMMSVEFGSGTLSNVQLELGSVATPFEFRLFAQELLLCKRYCQLLSCSAGIASTTSSFATVINFAFPMAPVTTVVLQPVSIRISDFISLDFTQSGTSVTAASIGAYGAFLTYVGFTGLTLGKVYGGRYPDSDYTRFEAEL